MVCIAVFIIYFLGVGYYSDRFVFNTYYGNINISGLTVSQAKEKIEQTVANKSIVLTENGKQVATIPATQGIYQFYNDQILEQMFTSQNPLEWFLNIVQAQSIDQILSEKVTVNDEKLESIVTELGIDNTQRQSSQNATIEYTDSQGYHVVAGQTGTEIDFQKLGYAVLESIENGTDTVALESAYQAPEINENSDEINEMMAYIDKVLSTSITLQIAGENIEIPQSEIEKWVHFNEQNQVVVDEDAVKQYLETLNEQYATVGTTRQFVSTLRGEVTVPVGILGWEIDIPQEIENIVADLRRGESVVRKAAFTGIGNRLGERDDIGSTYIEVDLVNQMMYLYVNGEVIVATNIVSGRQGTETVPGANAVIEMLRNTDLVGTNPSGVDYSVPVSYWIRFDYMAQGIHDASWQSYFGGNAYISSGSLGCINTPLNEVAIIYEYVDYGTPVIVF